MLQTLLMIFLFLGAAAKDVEDWGDDGTEGVPEPDAGVGAAAREPCQRTQGMQRQPIIWQFGYY